MSTATVAAIQRLVKLAEQERVPLGMTRLVKLLYLSDVECYRRFGRRLTELDWVFYHYGPYAFELETVLGQSMAEREEIPLPGGRIIKRVTAAEESGGLEPLDYKAEGVLTALFRQWATSDLRDLLDYVYFETEPMLSAKRGDRLDFTSVRPFEPPRDVRLNPRRLHEIRSKAKLFLASKPAVSTQPLSEGPDLAAALQLWEPDRAPLPTSVRFEVDPSASQSGSPSEADV